MDGLTPELDLHHPTYMPLHQEQPRSVGAPSRLAQSRATGRPARARTRPTACSSSHFPAQMPPHGRRAFYRQLRSRPPTGRGARASGVPARRPQEGAVRPATSARRAERSAAPAYLHDGMEQLVGYVRY